MMWKIARRFSVVPVEPSKLDLVLQRGRGLSDFELISVAKDLGNIDPQKLQKNSEMLSDLDTYFKTLSSRIRKMQTSDISLIMKSVVKNTELRSHDLTERFWRAATQELSNRVQEFDLELTAELAHNYCYIKSNTTEINDLLNKIAVSIEDFDILDYLAMPFHKLEDLMWSYTFRNVGNANLYKYLANAFLLHAQWSTQSYEKICKLAYFFSRAHLSRRNGGPEFFKKTEEIIWHAIHQGKITKIEQIDDVIHYLIPANIGSNDFRALLEFTLYRLLTDTTQHISIAQLIKIITAFTHFVIKYQPLDILLQQLVKDSLGLLNSKQLVQILWAYTRHNKASKDFIYVLISRIKETLKTDKDLSFRNYTYFMNSLVNSDIKDPEIWENYDELALKYLNSKNYDDHYLIKFLSLLGGVSWNNPMIYSIGISELMAPHRLPKDHPKDITRAIISACETPNLQDEEYLNFLHEKISKSINSMKPEEISKSVYSLALLNRGYPEIYTNFEARILQSDLEKLRPVNLGIACLGFGLIGMTNFCKAALANVTDCFHRHQGRVYDDYMSEDEENQNKLVLIQEKELDYTIHLTATSIVQMAWMAAALGNRDPLFWTDKLHESLIKIPMANYKYTINEWIWTAKTIQDEMNIVTALDPFHYGLLLQVLALVPPRGIQYDSYIAELEANIQAYPADLIAKMDKFNNPNPGFLESIIETAKSIGLDINHDKRNKLGMKLDLKINNKEIILYDKEDYIYMSHGYLNLKGTKDLLTHLKLKRQILRSIGTKPFEIPIGDWKDLSSEERKDYLSPLLK